MITSTAIAARLEAVRAEVAAACRRSDRDPASVTIVGVTKTHPLPVVRAALDAGLIDLGENRVQELIPKAEEAAAAGLAPRWHFVGHLQRNKVRDLLPHVHRLHSLDSERLLREIERRAAEAPRGARTPIPCYLEVNVGGEAQKHGIAPSGLSGLLRLAGESEAIEVVGLMTVAPRVAEAELARRVFRELRKLAEAHGLSGLSMGMTDDYRVAVEEGSTLVRIGRALFGERGKPEAAGR